MKASVKRGMMTVLCAGLVAAALPAAGISASTDHYSDSSTLGEDDAWQAYCDNWETLSADYTQVALNPGKDETELNFTWMTEKEGATPVVKMGTDKDNLTEFQGTTTDVDTKFTDGVEYVSNKVTVTGLEPGNTYYYVVVKNGVDSEAQTYTLSSTDDVKFLVVGDPQIGASKGQTQDGAELVNDAGAANTAARNDGFTWDRTLDIAAAENPDLDFIVSCGDQVNKTGQPKEEEFAAYLSASVLANIPAASTIGNHDSLNEDFSNHFTTPNATGLGATAAGGDYYYSYGNVLFITLNTNNYNAAEHKQAIDEAIAAYPDAQWRIVTIHQDIYGSGLDHSDTDGMILRTQLTPIFDAADIDVVLQGHDHTYSRSKMLQGDGASHDSYEFSLNEAGDDYDWDHAYDTTTDTMIALYPEDGDTEAAAALDAFHQDNICYTMEETDENTVTNPEGILYITTNSASGSKYYELLENQQDYIANRSQNWLPSYSVADVSGNTFTITTYQVNPDGSVTAIDDPFSIVKE
ncbi:MAG: fibronectin type III domain-containing protein [Lachnospiraceae bacterium]|jgi:hypothetical protein